MFTFHHPPHFFLPDLDVQDVQVSQFMPLYFSKQFQTHYHSEKQPLHYENRILVEKNDIVLHLIEEQGRVVRVEMAKVWDTLYHKNGTPIGVVLISPHEKRLHEYSIFTQFNNSGEEEKYFFSRDTLNQKQIFHHTALLWRTKPQGKIWLPEKNIISDTEVAQIINETELKRLSFKDFLNRAVVRYAKQGQPACLFTVAFWLREQGREQEAIHGLQKAAEKHFAFAWLELGFEYHAQRGLLGYNADKAATCFSQAAYGGLALANYQLALAYINGIGIEQSDTLALRHLQKAQEGGIAAASLTLGLYYRHGSFNFLRLSNSPYRSPHVQNVDHIKAAQLFFKAKEEKWYGTPIALYYLADAYRTGKGVRQDSQYAKALYHQAAEDGNIQHEEIQIATYYDGDVERLLPLAENSPFVAYLLGKMYWYGEAVPKNAEAAQRYLKIAAYSGHPCAEEAEKLLESARLYLRNHHFSARE